MYAILRIFLRLSVILKKNYKKRIRLILRIRIFVNKGPGDLVLKIDSDIDIFIFNDKTKFAFGHEKVDIF